MCACVFFFILLLVVFDYLGLTEFQVSSMGNVVHVLCHVILILLMGMVWST